MNQLRFLTVADAIMNSSAKFERAISAAFDDAVKPMTDSQKRNAFFPELVNADTPDLVKKLAA